MSIAFASNQDTHLSFWRYQNSVPIIGSADPIVVNADERKVLVVEGFSWSISGGTPTNTHVLGGIPTGETDITMHPLEAVFMMTYFDAEGQTIMVDDLDIALPPAWDLMVATSIQNSIAYDEMNLTVWGRYETTARGTLGGRSRFQA